MGSQVLDKQSLRDHNGCKALETKNNNNSSNEATNSTSTDTGNSREKPHFKPLFSRSVNIVLIKLLPKLVMYHPYLQYEINLQTDTKCEYQVSVALFKTPYSFYVHILSLKPQFDEMMKKIPELYKDTQPYKGIVNEGASVMAKFPKDGALYRATVLKCGPDGKYLVQNVDYGNKFVVKSTDIWQLKEEVMGVPRMAIHCSLLGVMPLDGQWNTDSIVAACFAVPKYYCAFKKFDGVKYDVSMWGYGIVSVAKFLTVGKMAIRLIENLTDLNVLVGQKIHCQVIQFDSYNKFYLRFISFGAYTQLVECRFNNHTPECLELMTLDELKQQLTAKKFIVYVNALDEAKLVVTLYSLDGAKMNVLEPDEGAPDAVTSLCSYSVFSTNLGKAYISQYNTVNSLYLKQVRNIGKLFNLFDGMEEVYKKEGKTEDLTTYEAGTVCAVNHSDGEWYRAIIRREDATECKIQFVDVGVCAQVSKDSLKKLDLQFHQPCAFALEVGLNLKVNDDALSKLKEWTNKKEIQVSLSVGDKGWVANLQLNGEDLCLKLTNDYPME